MPPTPHRDMWSRWVESVEGRLPSRSGSDPPLKKTRELVDWVKWAVLTVFGIAAVGWVVHEYISGFETKTDAIVAASANNVAHREMQDALDAQDAELSHQRDAYIRLELGQRSTNDRLDQLLALGRARTLAERRAAAGKVEEIQRRIDSRAEILSNRRAMERLSRQYREDPLGALDEL